ncbi:hypothetical protein DPMN_162458 [Dreissena polymorpha]|uniref:Uncharacterized protein n=1 Tax=Dreissena polymorpha TaxID=45954 RepID=A0A9D4ERJ6_DREPO|nr:hypothetical protein DPMN_162458 [Dreissena polymorpha]
MKLIKTSSRSRLRSATLNTLMTIKLLSESTENFQPEEAVDKLMVMFSDLFCTFMITVLFEVTIKHQCGNKLSFFNSA